jgi:hypothetical protein
VPDGDAAAARGTVAQQRLYQLIRQMKPITDRQFKIAFLDLDGRPSRSGSADLPRNDQSRRLSNG